MPVYEFRWVITTGRLILTRSRHQIVLASVDVDYGIAVSRQ